MPSLILVLLLGLVYGGAVLARYAVHDDYWALDAGLALARQDTDCLHLVHTASLVQVGRPLSAVLNCGLALGLPRVLDWGINHFHVAMSVLRGISLLCILAAALSFAAVLRRLMPPAAAVATTMLVFCLPGIGVLVGWSVMAIYTPGLLLVAAANWHVARAWDGMAEGDVGVEPNRGTLAAITACLTGALLFYQMNGFLFLLSPLAIILFGQADGWPRRRTIALRLLGAFLAAVVLYIVLQKGLVEGLLRPWLQLAPTNERTVSVNGIGGLLQNFQQFLLGYPLRRALNLWLIDDPALLQRFWMLLAVAGLVLALTAWRLGMRRRRAMPIRIDRPLIEQGLLVLTLLGLTAGINFVGEVSIKYRVLLPFQAAIVLVGLAWLGFLAAPLRQAMPAPRWRRVQSVAMLGAVAAAGIAVAAGVNRHYAAHAAAEFAFLEAGFSQFLRNPASTLVIARGRPFGRIAGDEYSVMTASFQDAAYGIEGMLALLDRKYHVPHRGYRILYRPGFVILTRDAERGIRDAVAPLPAGTIYVDFSDLQTGARAPFVGLSADDVVRVTASAADPLFGAEHLTDTAFRHAPWQTTAPGEPATVTIEFRKARPVSGLTLVPRGPEAIPDAPGAVDVSIWSERDGAWLPAVRQADLCPRYAAGPALTIPFPTASPPAGKLRLRMAANCGGAALELQSIVIRRD